MCSAKDFGRGIIRYLPESSGKKTTELAMPPFEQQEALQKNKKKYTEDEHIHKFSIILKGLKGTKAVGTTGTQKKRKW